ncbi:MAG: Potassium channel beta chain, partial [uncultured Corynebacteriales bacterium]
GIPSTGPQRPHRQRDRVRQLDHPRQPGRGGRRARLRAGRARRWDHHLRHRGRVRRHPRRVGPRPGAAGRAPGELRAADQGVLADRARAERPRPRPQAPHRELPRLPAPARHRPPRRLPGPPVRQHDPAGGDHVGVRRPGPTGQGPLPRRLGVAGRGDHRGRRAGPGTARAAGVQPAAVLDAVAGHRGRGRAGLRARGARADRLVPDRAGRADREVQAGRGAAGRVAGDRPDRWAVREADADRRGADPGAAAPAGGRGLRAVDGAAGDRLGAAEPERVGRDHRGQPARAGHRERQGGRGAAGRRRARPHRRDPRRRRRARPGQDGPRL